MVGIYKITNKITGKSYIGQSVDIKRRWRQHKLTKSENNKNKLYKDFEKYGLENFHFEIIEECKKEKLDDREIYWIEKFNTYRDGYNLTAGGTFMPHNRSVYLQLLSEMELYKKITSKQWQVYYYLLSISYYDAKSVENHRYVYKKDFSVSAAAKFLGISRPTIYTALSNLEKSNLLYEDKDTYLIYAKNWVKINNKVLKALLSLSAKDSKNIDILRVYLILKKIFELAKSKSDMAFTKKDLIEMLGHGITNTCEYDSIRGYLALLSFIKLIEIKSHTEYQDGLGSFVVYHLQSINDDIADGELISNIQAEVMSSRLPDYIKENFENFI